MDIVLVIGRVLFSALFARSGLQHLRDDGTMAGYAEAKGVRSARLMVAITGVMILAGAILIALGLWADLGALLIVVFLVPTALIMHAYWKIDDPQASHADSAHFYKDVALLGAAIVIFYLYNQVQDVPASLTDALFGKF
jgi:putative oxidoreductase